MNKLEEAGLIKKEQHGYVVDRVVLENLIRLKKTLIPRNFFYMIFLVTSLMVSIVFLRPPVLTREYMFALAVIIVAAVTAVYETARAMSKNAL